MGLEAKAKTRRKAVEVKEQRTEEQEEFELAQIRLRWKANDAEKARLLQAARERRATKKKEAAAAKAEENQKRADAQKKRKLIFKQIADRIKRKEDDWLKRIFDSKAERKRDEKMQRERNQESVKVWNSERWPIFARAIQRTEERRE